MIHCSLKGELFKVIILRMVGEIDNLVGADCDFFECLELLDGEDWAKDLLTADLHVIRHVGENGGLERQFE